MFGKQLQQMFAALYYVWNWTEILPVWWMKDSTINIHTSRNENVPACCFRATS